MILQVPHAQYIVSGRLTTFSRRTAHGWRTILCALLSLIIFAAPAHAQHITHKQYTVNEGLPGTVVYQCQRDKLGYLWFATNQGVSRFDGKLFKNFSREDGLPDLDIIKIYPDKHNNIWFISLTGAVSVLCNGTIRQLDCKGVIAIAENFLADSIVLLSTHLIPPLTHQYGYYASPNISGRWQFKEHFRRIYERVPIVGWPVLQIGLPTGVNFYFANVNVHESTLVIETATSRKKISFFNPTVLTSIISFTLPTISWPLPDGKGIIFHNIDSVYIATRDTLITLFALNEFGVNAGNVTQLNSIFYDNDGTVWLCTRNKGVIRVAGVGTKQRTVQYLLPGNFCTTVVKDRDNGYWFTTLNSGVYHMPDLYFSNLGADQALAGKNIKCIRTLNDRQLVAGCTDGTIAYIDRFSGQTKALDKWGSKNVNNRVMDIVPYGADLAIACDEGTYLLSPAQDIKVLKRRLFGKQDLRLAAAKAIYIDSDNDIMIASSAGAFSVNPSKKSENVFMSSRCNSVTGIGKIYYIGTGNGVYRRVNDSIEALGNKNPALAGIVRHIAIGRDTAVWAATQEGIVVVRKQKTFTIGLEQGLISNSCRHILLDGNTAWVSTENGMSKVDYIWTNGGLQYNISNITEEDGLLSNDVNQSAACGDHIWAATTKGISYLPKRYSTPVLPPPLLLIDRIASGNVTLPLSDTAYIDRRRNNLTIDVSCVNYRGNRDMYYEYRLNGLDTTWYRTISNRIEFTAIPYGEFLFELRVVNKRRMTAYPGRLLIIHEPPFWKTTAFAIFVYALSLLLIAGVLYFIYRANVRKKERVFAINKKMHDLEMLAMQARMNPHFIFNCLTSIQHYILKADVVNANLYLHKFSALLRETLQYSSGSYIALTEEVKILELYLEMEKMRLRDRMEYQLIISDELKNGDYVIPSMVVQPYVENAILHGISPLQGRKGIVTVTFELSGKYIECNIDDDGIGIEAARENNQSVLRDRPSVGNSITENRINMFNSTTKEKIILRTIDKKSVNPSATGTLIQLFFPV
jgi:ligand-binding sensor domain-containing protein